MPKSDEIFTDYESYLKRYVQAVTEPPLPQSLVLLQADKRPRDRYDFLNQVRTSALIMTVLVLTPG